MAVFDVENPPAAPDMFLESALDLAETFTIADSSSLVIAPGDWVSVSPGYISDDPTYGQRFQVCNMYPDAGQVGILYPSGYPVAYAETTLSTSIVLMAQRKVI